MRKWNFGVCGPVEQMGAAREAGFSYYEMALAPLARLDRAAFEEVARKAEASGLPVYAMNVLLPGDLPVVGPAADPGAIRAYVEAALSRAARLGARVVVFGSGASRRAPDGFSPGSAMAQIRDFLLLLGDAAKPLGITVVIEPLNRGETNMIHTVSEAAALARETGLANVRALGDTYHMYLEGESFPALVEARDVLRHMHVANPVGRVFPAPNDGCDYAALFLTLERAGYDGGISVEAGTKDFATDARRAMEVFRG